MQLVVKYSINLELQIYQNLSDIVFCDQPFKTGQNISESSWRIGISVGLDLLRYGMKTHDFSNTFFCIRKTPGFVGHCFQISSVHLQWKDLQVKDLTSYSSEASLGEGVAFLHNRLMFNRKNV